MAEIRRGEISIAYEPLFAAPPEAADARRSLRRLEQTSNRCFTKIAQQSRLLDGIKSERRRPKGEAACRIETRADWNFLNERFVRRALDRKVSIARTIRG